MGRKHLLALVAAISLSTIPLAALSQSHDQLVERYAALAGSRDNADALVRGLREGDTVTLARWNSSVVFIPPTGKMGNGNVDQALALAQATLAKHGLSSPTPTELAYALMGGNVKTPNSGTIALDGILRLRSEGKGWGQIAQAYGLKLGEAKRAEKAEAAPKAKSAPKTEPVAKISHTHKPERPEKPVRPEKVK